LVKRNFFILLTCTLVSGCDHFPGPVLRNEFPGEIKVSIIYDDGRQYSEKWPPCKTVFAGSTTIGRFGIDPAGIDITKIIVEFSGKTEINLNKEAIQELTEKEKRKRAGKYWVLNQSGINFSTSGKCSPP